MPSSRPRASPSTTVPSRMNGAPSSSAASATRPAATELADAARGDRLAGALDEGDDLGLELGLATQEVPRPRGAVPEAEVLPHAHVPRAEAAGEESRQNAVGLDHRELPRERDHDQLVHAELHRSGAAFTPVVVRSSGGSSGLRTRSGWGSNVTTLARVPWARAQSRADPITRRWPRCTPSKVPIATARPSGASGTSSRPVDVHDGITVTGLSCPARCSATATSSPRAVSRTFGAFDCDAVLDGPPGPGQPLLVRRRARAPAGTRAPRQAAPAGPVGRLEPRTGRSRCARAPRSRRPRRSPLRCPRPAGARRCRSSTRCTSSAPCAASSKRATSSRLTGTRRPASRTPRLAWPCDRAARPPTFTADVSGTRWSISPTSRGRRRPHGLLGGAHARLLDRARRDRRYRTARRAGRSPRRSSGSAQKKRGSASPGRPARAAGPVANGSSVPACPTFAPRAIGSRRTCSTTSCEVTPAGFATSRTPLDGIARRLLYGAGGYS